MYKILAVDDDIHYLDAIKRFLEFKKYDITCVASPFEALDMLKTNEFNCILSDVKMPGMDGLKFLQKVRQIHPLTPVIMISGQSTISIAVNAIQLGAYDFIEKTSDSNRITTTIQKAIEKHQWNIERQNLLLEISEKYKMIGQSAPMRSVFSQIAQVAPTKAKVLILGETGTGKELVARALHHNSPRNGKRFVPVNCASIPENLLESELFGHKKGSFTGAIADKTGKFLLADGGTLFLDEIGDLPLSLQAKLLRVLEDEEIEIIGSNQPIKVDIRIISATNKNLEALIEQGKFREDLFHRLNVVAIKVPSLNERPEDIPILADYFLTEFTKIYNKQISGFSKQALEYLSQYDWKGNIRQLKNVVEKMCILTKNHTIQPMDVFFALDMEQTTVAPEMVPRSLKGAVNAFEKNYIHRILLQNEWKIQQTASILEIERTTLFKKMRLYKIEKTKAKQSN